MCWDTATGGTRPRRPEIVRMGEICRILAHEAVFAGQQVIADAAQLLRDHAITGQAPAEDGQPQLQQALGIR
jgi:hypothetical protein